MKKAAVMLIIKDDLVLAVSRKYNHSKFGLPGGKVDDNETFKAAAIRETFEETGITVNDCDFVFLAEDSNKYITQCFFAINWSGDISSSEEGVVKWVNRSVLTNNNAPYPIYNRDALKAMDLYLGKY